MPAIGQLSVLAISLKPGGSSVTLSPWLIHTCSMPWPSGVVKSCDAVEQRGVAVGAHLGIAELALCGRASTLPPSCVRHGLHAVADAQHRHAQLEHRLRRLSVVLLVDAGVAAGQDDALERAIARVGADPVVAHVAGMDLAKHMRLAHAARDQLGDLGAEIEDEDFLVCMAESWKMQGRSQRSD